MRLYDVTSPEYKTGGYSGGLEPPEYGRDYLAVYARDARRAKVLAVRAWRRRERLPYGAPCRERRHYFSCDCAVSPFCGLRATRRED